MDRQHILDEVRRANIKFIRLQFSDIAGLNKNVELPVSQLDKALSGDVSFDGSAIEGFARVEESDMLLAPDLSTFQIEPFASTSSGGEDQGRIARLLCDIHAPDHSPFPGCPRQALAQQCRAARELGLELFAGPEVEFFMFQQVEGVPTTVTHDAAGYFDLAPFDLGEECRREIIKKLEAMGVQVAAAHHEVAPGQHEIDLEAKPALRTADDLITFRYIVRRVARDMGLHATFMPKPVDDRAGSGMHMHLSLREGQRNVFEGEGETNDGISDQMRWFIGGLLTHARGFCAITNPLVNSFKRLVPGYEAPTHLAWSHRNRSPLIRVPARRGEGTRCELRMPDPSCNPYLALSVILAAGLDGIRTRVEPPPPVSANLYTMSARERGRLKIKSLPRDLGDALSQFEKNSTMRKALGEHICDQFLQVKRQEWEAYSTRVHPWERETYLALY